MGIEYIEYRTGLFELNSGSTIRQGRGRGGRWRGEGEVLTETNCGLSKIKGTRTFYISLRNVREVKSVPK